MEKYIYADCGVIWVKVFKDRPSKISGRYLSKTLKL